MRLYFQRDRYTWTGYYLPEVIYVYINYIDTHLADKYGKDEPGPWFNIKISSYQYRKSNSGDKTILRPSYLHNGISYTDETVSLYWIRALDTEPHPH